ncbi:MAG: ABC transporter ATP-binding protein [Gammaproteobacteria bacterium]|nr:ABC transporter ATP-binding protein [Gammaproteobacteria bacterium]
MRGVSASFATPHGNFEVVREVDLTLGEGEFLCVVGPTGCGKSTLLNLVAGLLSPSAGTVLIDDEPLTGIHPAVGYLFQADALLPWRDALENVALGLRFRGVPRQEAEAEAHAWLQRVGLAGAARRYPHQLSGGMKKRVALAQVLAVNPRILLMDEPLAALDVQTRAQMENQLLRLWAQDRRSVIFITHDLEEAIALGDRVIVMSAGPSSRPVGSHVIDLPRPREVEEIRMTPRFLELQREIWRQLRREVHAGQDGAGGWPA